MSLMAAHRNLNSGRSRAANDRSPASPEFSSSISISWPQRGIALMRRSDRRATVDIPLGLSRRLLGALDPAAFRTLLRAGCMHREQRRVWIQRSGGTGPPSVSFRADLRPVLEVSLDDHDGPGRRCGCQRRRRRRHGDSGDRYLVPVPSSGKSAATVGAVVVGRKRRHGDPPDRWPDLTGGEIPPWGAFLEQPADFDAAFFGIFPRAHCGVLPNGCLATPATTRNRERMTMVTTLAEQPPHSAASDQILTSCFGITNRAPEHEIVPFILAPTTVQQ
jgi:hypothetical protein